MRRRPPPSVNTSMRRLPAQFQIVTESWNRVVAVPYIIYMPEKDRLLMLVNCDYPHHAEVLFSKYFCWSHVKRSEAIQMS